MSRIRRARPADDPTRYSGGTGECPRCTKAAYATRKQAKTAAKRLFPGERLSVYRCGDYYHFGHLPTVVRRGETDRSSLRAERYGL